MPIEDEGLSYVKHGAERLAKPWSGGWMQRRWVMDDSPGHPYGLPQSRLCWKVDLPISISPTQNETRGNWEIQAALEY